MVTTFNSTDMTRFGEYLLSKKRTDLIKSNHDEGDGIPLEERLRSVYHTDFENWKSGITFEPAPKFEYFCQKQELPNEGANQNNPHMEVMGALGWELCGLHDGIYVYKRSLL